MMASVTSHSLRLPVPVEVIFVVLVTTSIQEAGEKERERERDSSRSGGASGGHVDRTASKIRRQRLHWKDATLLSRDDPFYSRILLYFQG
jgi:hypothetical protein